MAWSPNDECALAAGAAVHAHIARFAAAYPCLNRGADFRFLANNRRANPSSIQPKLSRLSRPIEHAIDLARHNEVVLVHGAGKHF
jgi:hypothetical protein